MTVEQNPRPYDPLKPLRDALLDFVKTIEAAGGCEKDRKGYIVPRADPEWIDLGEPYIRACTVLDREPLVHRD